MSDDKFKVLVENILAGIVVVQDNHIIYYNEKLKSMADELGLEISHNLFTEYVHPDDASTLLGRHKKRLEGEPTSDIVEFRIVNPEGGVFWVEGTGSLIEWAGRPAQVAYLRNITHRKQTEKSLEILKDAAIALARATKREEIFPACLESAMQISETDCGGIYLASNSRRKKKWRNNGAWALFSIYFS